MDTASAKLQLAKRGPIISIIAYLLLATSKLVSGYWLNSSSLIADGFNNLSDIAGNVALLIGLHLASRPADEDHKFGHWKIEDLSSLVTSFIMFTVGIQVLIQTVQKIFLGKSSAIDLGGALVGVLSGLVMHGVYLYNKKLSKQVQSSALAASAKDNLTDAVTSIGTSLAIVASSFNLIWLDNLFALLITYFILKTAYDIFMEATFSLSDGFDDKHLKAYEAAILEIPKIYAVKSQRGRTYGSNIYLDIILEMNPDLSVYESHEITEQVEELLRDRFEVYDIDIHVEPAPIPEDEIFENVYHKLYKKEKSVLAKIPDYEHYLSKDFRLIDQDGAILNKEDVITRDKHYLNNFKYFKMTSISQKTKLISYQLDGCQHTSLWRRHEKWFLLYHQITPLT